jgi:hypothetical protein
MLAFAVAYMAFSVFWGDAIDQKLDEWFNLGAGNEYQGNDFTIIFYPIDYEYDIMKDKEYLGLDRNIYYYEHPKQYGSADPRKVGFDHDS